jgi:acyl-coenzyme A synthetase/AMP-(fatty) acid ligase
MNKSSRLIWIKEMHSKISFAPWLLGSTVFFKDTNNIQTTLQTLKTFPIDTLCTSANDYRMLDQDTRAVKTHLEQLLSTEAIKDSTLKSRWQTLTNLRIVDGK